MDQQPLREGQRLGVERRAIAFAASLPREQISAITVKFKDLRTKLSACVFGGVSYT